MMYGSEFFHKFTFTVLDTYTIIHTKSINQPIFLLLSFLFFSFKFMPKKLGGAVVAWWIILYVVSRYRLCYVVPYHTVLWINHLFQNGRALLKCRIFILLQLVIPTLKSHAATRHVTTRTCPLWTNISRRSSYFLSLLLIAFRFRAICVVVEFHSSHSFRHFAANKLLIFVFFRENSTGFDVIRIIVRFVSCLLCCCWVSLQPQFRHFSVKFLLIFVFFAKIRQVSSSKKLRSLRIVSAVLL
jgi:hypothetical protein